MSAYFEYRLVRALHEDAARATRRVWRGALLNDNRTTARPCWSARPSSNCHPPGREGPIHVQLAVRRHIR